MKSFAWLIVFIATIMILSSCNNAIDNTFEPVDIIKGINVSETFAGKQLLTIVRDTSLNAADAVLLTWIKTSALSNREHVSPETSDYIRAFFRFPSQVAGVKFGPTNLALDQIVAFPKYKTPIGWNDDTYTYRDKAPWQVTFASGQSLTDTAAFCEPITLLDVSCGDTFVLSRSYQMTWNPSQDSDRLWLSFTWLPAGSKTDQYTNGFEVDDDGEFPLNQNELTNLGITGDGMLTVNMFRYKAGKPVYFENMKIVTLNLTDARITMAVVK